MILVQCDAMQASIYLDGCNASAAEVCATPPVSFVGRLQALATVISAGASDQPARNEFSGMFLFLYFPIVVLFIHALRARRCHSICNI